MFSFRCFNYFFLLVFVVFVWIPLGCGGGNNPSQGVFIDAPVEGLSYETDTQSGVTDPEGHFSFFSSETVHFFLGDTVLGQATAQVSLSPFDLVPGSIPITQSRDIRAFINDFHKSPVSPLEPVINRVIFLQTLDEDGDLSNGLHIPDLVSDLLSGVSVDFQKKYDRFQKNAPFRQLLADGFAQGLWGGGKPIQSAARAMDHLYNALRLSVDVDRWTSLTDDSLTDMNPPSTTKRIFDTEGRLSRQEEDTDGNGTIDERLGYVYDSFDRVLRIERDTTGDGVPDQITHLQYDARGNSIREEMDHNGDGFPEYIDTRTYNELGYKTRSEVDSDGNGALDSVSVFEYDVEGNFIREEFDDAPIGSINAIRTYQYDSRGNQIRFENDSNADGTPNTIAISQYDANDNKIREEIDSNGDGTPNIIETDRYDANNNLIRREVDTDTDGNLDGNPDGILSFQYDELGNTTRMEQDLNADGTPESIVTFQYDARGNRTRIEEDAGNDGIIDRVVTFGAFEPGNWMSVFSELVD